MRTTSQHATRHRLLEGILLRLARLPDADAFVLRGGMLLRRWFLARPAADLDLVAAFPFGIEETARRFRPLLADRGIDDGVRFDPERVRVQGIWQNTGTPGVRLFASGEVDGAEEVFRVDVTFGVPLAPTPERREYTTASGLAVPLRVCRPETVVGRKLHALLHMGRRYWRPKDLNDLRLLLGQVPMNSSALLEAVAVAFPRQGDAAAGPRSVFGRGAWWGMKLASARWQDFVKTSRGQGVPADLGAVVDEVSGRLAPVMERLP